MRTVIVCCDPDWQDWPLLVRTRALDLYHVAQQVDFWDSANSPDPDAAVWGNWPRYFVLGGPAVVADLEEKISRLAPGDNLASLFVYGSPQELESPASPGERRGAPPSTLDLKTLQGRATDVASYQSNPVLRIGVFRCDGRPQAAAKAADLIARQLFDSVFFIGTRAPTPAARAMHHPRQFDSVRLIADMARAVDEQREERWLWAILRARPHAPPPVYWLNPPAEGEMTNPSAMIAGSMVAYFDQQTNERGLAQSGEALKDFDALETTIASQVRQAEDLRSLRPGEVSTKMQQTGAANELFSEVDDRWARPEPPSEPETATAAAWLRELQTSLDAYFRERRQRIQKRQAASDPIHKRHEIDAAEQASSVINAVATGLTGNALARVEAILVDLHPQRARFVALAENARAAIAGIIEGERCGATETQDGSRMPIESFRSFEMLREKSDAFLAHTGNCLNLRWMSRGAIAIMAVLYLTFGLHTWAVAGDEPIVRILLLGLWLPAPQLAKPITLAGVGVVLFWLWRRAEQRARLDWAAARDDIAACATEIARIISRVDFFTVRSADATAVTAWLAQIERRLMAVAANIAGNPVTSAISQLREAATGQSLGTDEQRAFENALGAQLQREPMGRWIKVSLNAAPSLGQHPITLESNGWTGERIIASQLRPERRLRVRIDDISPQRPEAGRVA